jgi:tetratricopeptide (TPR) repeat protein
MRSGQTRAVRFVRCTALPVLVATLVARLAALPFAQVSQPRDAPRDWQSWIDAVRTHAPGELDEPVARVAPWSRAELQSVLAAMRRETRSEPQAGQLRLVERALMLHADVAFLHRLPDGYNLPAGPGGVTLFEDGRAVGRMSGTVHWEFARRLLDQAPEGEDRARIGRWFYRATAAVLQLWGEYAELTTHLSDGRRLLGDDAVLLLYEGTMRQAYAGPRVQRFFDERRRAQSGGAGRMPTTLPTRAGGVPRPAMSQLPAALPSARDSRRQAERLFRRALAIDPTLAEARLRLAQMLGDDGRHDAAAAELERAMATRLPPLLDYYGALLTGREARARGQLGLARAAFERAATVYPSAPAPMFGLSELAMARGDRAEGLAHLLRGTAAADAEGNEPWWWIDRAHEPSARALVDEMRRVASP